MISFVPISLPVGLSAKVLDLLAPKEGTYKDLFLPPKESHGKKGQPFSPTPLLVGLSAKVLDLLALKESILKGLLSLKERTNKDLFLAPKEGPRKKGQPFFPTPLLVGLSAKVLDLLPSKKSIYKGLLSLKEGTHKDLFLPPKESHCKKGQLI